MTGIERSPEVAAALDAMLTFGAATRAWSRATEKFTHGDADAHDYTVVEVAQGEAMRAQNALHAAIYAVHDAAAGVVK